MNTTMIGSGVAAWTLVRELRKADPEHSIRVITADAGDFYSKPMLSNALASGKTPEKLVMNAADKLAEQQNAELVAHTRVTELDLQSKTINTSSGQFEFDHLVLCVGADTISIPVEGDGAGSILSVNGLGDYEVFREKLEGKKHVSLLGAGLIGCEFANDLRKGGYEVTVYDLADRPLPRLLPEQASHYLQEQLEAKGVQWKLGRTVKQVQTTPEGFKVTDSEGETIHTDLVLSAIGLKPSIQLADAAGLKVDKGIVIDELGRTSHPNVFALGDCAQYFGKHILPYIMPVMQGARAMAKTLAGTETPIQFPPMPVTIKTPDCPTVVSPPPEEAKGDWDIERSENGVKALYKSSEGKLLGMALLGEFTKERQTYTPELPSIQ
ncbi:MAG: FAD-dependent oxidoreductase [Limnobacter sp.]|nr:FAD-dependent oxidoreductase [Limnobacter sp.]